VTTWNIPYEQAYDSHSSPGQITQEEIHQWL
jgi:hypothetical protein